MGLARADIVDWIARALDRLELADPAGPLGEATELLGRGVGLDSVDAIQIVSALEESFDLTVDDEELHPEIFATVGSLADFIERKLQ